MALNDYISKGEFDRRVKLIEEKLKFIKDDGLKNRLDELNEEYVDKLRHANFDINNLRSDLEEVVGEEGNIEELLNSFVTGYNNFTANTLRFNDVFDTDGQFTGKIRPLSVETAALSVGTRSQQLALNGVEFRVLPYSSGNGTLDIVSSTNSRTGTTTGVAGYMFHYGFGTDTDPKVYKINAESKPINDDKPYYIYAKLPYTHNDVYTTVPISFDEDSYKLHIGELYERTGSSPSYSYTKVLTYTSGTYYKNAGTSERPIYSEVEIDQDNYFKNVFELYTKIGDTYTPLSLPEYDSNKTYCTKSTEDIITYDSSSTDNNTAIIFIDKNQITLDQLSGYLTIKLGYISAELSTTNSRKERKVDMTYGSTTIDGRLITTGKIEGNGVSIDLDTGKVIGDLEIKSGNTSITMDQYLSGKYGEIYDYVLGDSTTGIQKIINDVKDDLEGQIDGRIDTWFGNVQPGPNVYPENEWTTTSDKDNHLGDLYYDDSTGYAYRYTKNGNNYTWSKIEDTDMTRALAIAKSAKETADGKMSVFLDDSSNPPIPPYSEGDMWVNATYPKTGTKTYNDETLVCIDRHFESCANASYSQSTIYYKIENNEYVVDDEVTSENFNTKKSSLYKQIFNIADWQSSNRAIAEVDNVTDDGIISKGSEKASLKKEFEEITGTYNKALDAITTFGVSSEVTNEKDDLDDAYDALSDVMDIILDDTNENTSISGDLNMTKQEFRDLWVAYYSAEAAINDAIQKAAQDKITRGVAAAQGELLAIRDGSVTIAGGMITNNLLELKNIINTTKVFDDFVSGRQYYRRLINKEVSGTTIKRFIAYNPDGGYTTQNNETLYPPCNLWEETTQGTKNSVDGIVVTSEEATTGTEKKMKQTTFHYGGGEPGVVTSGLSGIDNFPVFWAGGDEVQAANYIQFKKDWDAAISPNSGSIYIDYKWFGNNNYFDFIYDWTEFKPTGTGESGTYPIWVRDSQNKVLKADFIKAIMRFNTYKREGTYYYPGHEGHNPNPIDTDADIPRLPVVVIDFDGFCKFGDFYIYDNQAYYNNASGFGHYALTLNGTQNGSGTSLGSFYAPTGAGIQNQLLVANASGIPSWKATASGAAYATSNNGALTFGTLPIAQGGTGQTSQANINKAFIGALGNGSSDVSDGTEFVSSYASNNGFSDSNAVNVAYKRSFLKVWNYIKGKMNSDSAVNISGNAATSDYVKYQHTNEINFKNVPSTITWFNYRNADTDSLNTSDISVTYKFGNFNAKTSNTTLEAANFTGNAATATTASKLSTVLQGSLTNPVYFTSGGIPAPCAYSLSSTVNAGTANYLAYYSGANTISKSDPINYLYHNSTTSECLMFHQISGINKDYIGYNSNHGSLWYNYVGQKAIQINNNGNVRIGSLSSTDSGYQLYVDGTSYLNGITEIPNLLYVNDYIRLGQGGNVIDGYRKSTSAFTGLHLNYYSNGNTTLSYGGGNVGIGTTSPAYKLDVNGDIKSSNQIRSIGAGEHYFEAQNSTTTQRILLDSASGICGLWSNGYVNSSNTFVSGSKWLLQRNKSNEVELAGTVKTSGDFYATGAVTALQASSSDKRLKKNIKLFNAIEIVEKLKPVQFEWNNKAKKYNENFKDGKNYGLIAQDSDGIIDNLVFDLPDGKGYKGVRYEKLIPILLQAIKEQQKEIDELKKLVKNK